VLTNIHTHESYLNFIVEQLDLYFNEKSFLKDILQTIVWNSLVDLTDTAILLTYRYLSNPRGRKPRYVLSYVILNPLNNNQFFVV
jgi:hypothetical protein